MELAKIRELIGPRVSKLVPSEVRLVFGIPHYHIEIEAGDISPHEGQLFYLKQGEFLLRAYLSFPGVDESLRFFEDTYSILKNFWSGTGVGFISLNCREQHDKYPNTTPFVANETIKKANISGLEAIPIENTAFVDYGYDDIKTMRDNISKKEQQAIYQVFRSLDGVAPVADFCKRFPEQTLCARIASFHTVGGYVDLEPYYHSGTLLRYDHKVTLRCTTELLDQSLELLERHLESRLIT